MPALENDVSDHLARDAYKKLSERRELEAELAAIGPELEGQYLAAENGDAEAQSRIDWLERREAELGRLIKQKAVAERDLLQKADEARGKEATERDRRQRQSYLKRAASLPARAKDLERATASFLIALNAYSKLADDLHLAYSETKWPHPANAHLYPEKVKAFIAQHLHAAMQAADVKKLPVPAYSMAEWPGLEAKVKEGVAWLKSTLSGEAPPSLEVDLPQYVQPEPVQPSVEPVDAEEILSSGRAYVEQERAVRNQAQHVEINPFTGDPI